MQTLPRYWSSCSEHLHRGVSHPLWSHATHLICVCWKPRARLPTARPLGGKDGQFRFRSSPSSSRGRPAPLPYPPGASGVHAARVTLSQRMQQQPHLLVQTPPRARRPTTPTRGPALTTPKRREAASGGVHSEDTRQRAMPEAHSGAREEARPVANVVARPVVEGVHAVHRATPLRADRQRCRRHQKRR